MITMRVSALSGLTGREQDRALVDLSTDDPGSVVVRYTQVPLRDDLAVAGRTIVRAGWCVDEAEASSSSGCLSCAIVDDLTRLLPELAATPWSTDVLVVLPPGVSAATVLDGCAATAPAALAPRSLTVGTVMVAIDVGTLEDRLWSPETLADAHVAVAEDDLSLGEFLVSELLVCDTHILLDPAGTDTPSDADALSLDAESVRSRARAGRELAEHIAPQARAVTVRGHARCGNLPAVTLADTYDENEAEARTELGAVSVPIRDHGELIASHVVRLERPLHPERLAVALHTVAAGVVWSRGRVWIASMPARRVGWLGVGPEISFTDAGGWLADGAERFRMDSLALLTWHPVHGDRGTVLAFTGRDLAVDEIESALLACELTPDELALGLDHWSSRPDPLDLRGAFGHVHELDHEPHETE